MIIYKVSEYRKFKPDLTRFLTKYSHRKLSSVISEFSHLIGMPVVVVYYLYEELYGPSEEITESIKRLEKFYNCKVVD